MKLSIQAIRSEGGSRYCSITDENSNTLLHLALLHGQTEHAKDIIQVQSYITLEWSVLQYWFYSQISKDVIDAENDKFKTPLHLAIEAGNIE